MVASLVSLREFLDGRGNGAAENESGKQENMKASITRCAVAATFLTLSATLVLALPNAKQNEAADHGPYPKEYEQIVQKYIHENFKDPYSIRDLSIQKPSKGWVTGAWIFGEKPITYGWEIIFAVNGKNSYGAYNGLEKIDLVVRDGKIIKVMNLTHPELTGGSINAPRF
jgi:hypothetical protein